MWARDLEIKNVKINNVELLDGNDPRFWYENGTPN